MIASPLDIILLEPCHLLLLAGFDSQKYEHNAGNQCILKDVTADPEYY